MNFVSTGLLVSCICLVLLLMLFRYEEKHDVRIMGRMRRYADFFVLRSIYMIGRILKFFGRDSLRQIVHYVFHTCLKMLIAILKRGEKGLQNVIRVNKTLAKNAERENIALSKLEEIALHKVESALTEKEKRAHKERSLNGL